MDVILAVAGTSGMHASTDKGVTWAAKTHPKPGFAGLVASGGDAWLYVQSDVAADVAYVSGDLESWDLVTLPAVRTWTHLKFMLGQFYLFSTTTDYYRSTDGVTWTAHAAPIAVATTSLIDASASLILLVEAKSAATTNIYSSADGAAWLLAGTHSKAGSNLTRAGMRWTGGSFSIFQGAGNSPSLDKSVDGAAWASTASPLDRAYYDADATIGCAAQSSSTSVVIWAGDAAAGTTKTGALSAALSGVSVIAGRILLRRASILEYSDDGVTWVRPEYDFTYNLTLLVGGTFPDAPALMDTLTFSDLLDGAVSEVAISHDTLTFSSSALTLTELFSETYFDTLLFSDILTSSESLTADLVSTLYMSTLIGGVVLEDGGRVLLSEPIQYGVNVVTGALTRYQGFGFDSYARCGQTLYGLRADGLYRIRPGSDNGQPIQVAIDLGDTPFSEEQGKRIEAVYLGISTDGDAYVRLKAGEAEYTYKAIQHDEMARATPGKGLTGRRWTLSLEVVDATELTLDMVEVRYGASARRLRGKS